jgi:hypothetical protein
MNPLTDKSKTPFVRPLFIDKDELKPKSVSFVVKLLWVEFLCLIGFSISGNPRISYYWEQIPVYIGWVCLGGVLIHKLNTGRRWARALLLVVNIFCCFGGFCVWLSTLVAAEFSFICILYALLFLFILVGLPIINIVFLCRKDTVKWCSLPEKVPMEQQSKQE